MRIRQNQPHSSSNQELMLAPGKGTLKAESLQSRNQIPALDRTQLATHREPYATSRMAKSTPSTTGIGCCLERLKSNQSSSADLKPSRHSSSVEACAQTPINSGIDP